TVSAVAAVPVNAALPALEERPRGEETSSDLETSLPASAPAAVRDGVGDAASTSSEDRAVVQRDGRPVRGDAVPARPSVAVTPVVAAAHSAADDASGQHDSSVPQGFDSRSSVAELRAERAEFTVPATDRAVLDP